MAFTNLNKRLVKLDHNKLSSSRRSKKKMLRNIAIFLIILVLITYLPVRGIYSNAKKLSEHSKLINNGLKANDFNALKQGIDLSRSDISSINGWLNWLFWIRVIPYFGGFYMDAKHFAQAGTYEMNAAQKIINSLEPYKSEIGLNGVPTPGQDKIAQLTKILDKTIPNLDKIEPDLKLARQEAERVQTSKYPEMLGSRKLRVRVEEARNFIIGAHLTVSEYRDALMIAPTALGQPTPKNYLMLFQNDKELRATGGFLTAYAFLRLDKGHLSTTMSDDIYRLDEKLLNVCLNVICPLTPPGPIVKYLPEANGKPRSAWSMRDSNLSPDLPTSMKDFEKMYGFLGAEKYDGVILIDTNVVEELIRVTGPIKVFDTTYSSETDKRCNCPNVIYELEHYAEVASKGEEDRKAILGTLMQQLLATVLKTGPEKMADFVNVGVKLAANKDVMFYMHDQKTQAALSKLNWTGEIKRDTGNYLHINDSNFAGGKSNLYVTEKVDYALDTTNNKVKLSIEYKNPQPFNTWLNGILRDYVRIYVPVGSKLINSKGSDDPVNTVDDANLNKTYFDAFVVVRPQNSRVLNLEFQLPSGIDTKTLTIQKQPGSKDHQYNVKVGGRSQNFNLDTDKNLNF